MKTYTSFDLVEFGQPFVKQQREFKSLEPNEVRLKILRSGVCHSDIHIAEGYFDLGEEGTLSMADRGMVLPRALGHEMVGAVEATGSAVTDIAIGSIQLIFPWIGCGECKACLDNRDNDCMKMRSMGLVQDGGYATHAIVQHPRYLVDVGDLDLDTVAPHACSGLTVYSALKKMGPLREGEALAIMGTGGLGLNAIAIARAMGYGRIIAVDVDDQKLAAALEMGADARVNSTSPEAIAELQDAANGQLFGVLDTVGIPATSHIAVRALLKTGKYVVVGLHGGDFKMPSPWLPQKALRVQGSHVGNCTELRELIALVRSGAVKQIPIEIRPLDQVNQAMSDLHAGKVNGRIVLSGE